MTQEKINEIRWTLPFMGMYSYLLVGGLTNLNLHWYIKDYFKNDLERDASRLLQVIKENDVLAEILDFKYLTWTPSYARELCLMWEHVYEEEREEVRGIKTISEFFKKTFKFLKEYYVKKNSENAEVRKELHARVKNGTLKR